MHSLGAYRIPIAQIILESWNRVTSRLSLFFKVTICFLFILHRRWVVILFILKRTVEKRKYLHFLPSLSFIFKIKAGVWSPSAASFSDKDNKFMSLIPQFFVEKCRFQQLKFFFTLPPLAWRPAMPLQKHRPS